MIPFPAKYNYACYTAKGRLRYYKEYVEVLKKRNPEHSQNETWRSVTGYVSFAEIRPPSSGCWSEDREKYYCSEIPPGCREVGSAEDILRLRHTGYYTDREGRGLCYGVVVQYPARNGIPRYYAAIEHKDYDSVTLFLGTVFDEKEDAAREADECASIEAESFRESEEEDMAEQKMGEAVTELKDSRIKCLCLLREVRAERTDDNGVKRNKPEQFDQPNIFEACLAQIRSLRRDMKQARKQIKELKENFPQLFDSK
jgi:hypothetical protein